MVGQGVFRGRGGFGDGGTILVLDRAKIAAFNFPGGMTYRWANGVVREIVFVARGKLSPGNGIRTGAMYASIDSSVTPDGTIGVFANVRVGTDHGLIYHEGTNDPAGYQIRPRPGNRFLVFRPINVAKPIAVRKVHRGQQRSRPFLRDAMLEVLASRGVQ